jgi:hypothetical protein
MDLKEISLEINDLLEQRRKDLELTFIEDKHIYYMKDLEGIVRDDFPSVSRVIKRFHKAFDAPAKALEMAKGDRTKQQQLLAEWRAAGDYSTNMGSRVHYVLESEIVDRYGNYKEVRQPIFECDESQIVKGDNMIKAGVSFLDLMNERGAVLLDTEIVLGDNELGYTGQPDKIWLMMNKDKTNYGIVITDWKTNQPKNFEVHHYTGKLYPPFNDYHDNALGHYYLQLPLYIRLLLKMLSGTKYADLKLLGGVVVLLKDDGTFVEYKVPPVISSTILRMDLTKYTRK